MDRKQNNGRRCKIVQDFVKTIADNTQRLVCFLYMRGYNDDEVLQTLHIGKQQLKQIKNQLAIDLHKAGICLVEG